MSDGEQTQHRSLTYSPVFLPDSDYAGALCDPTVCRFHYTDRATPSAFTFNTGIGGPFGYESLGGSKGHLFRVYGTIRGTVADNSADGSYSIQQGGYNCDVDPKYQYYSGGNDVLVNGNGDGIVKW